MKKIYKVIVDTDPGVDDTNGLVYILNDPQFDIKLLAISHGNVHIDKCLRNMCHILDIFNKDIPVVKGYSKRLGTNPEDAANVHGKEGMGSYIPPKTQKHKPLDMDAADAIYEVLKKYPKEITLVVLGPHTNVAYLLIKYPDSKDLIKDIVMMGGAPFGLQTNPNYNSFNIRTDAPAFKMTVDTNLPTVMCPSSIGRDWGYFTEEFVKEISKTNQVGRFLAKTFDTYWEHGYPDRRIATNDISALYYITNPKLYITKTAFMEVDTEKSIGKTIPHFDNKGNFKIVVGLKRKKFLKLMMKKLKIMGNIEITDKNFLKNVQ